MMDEFFSRAHRYNLSRNFSEQDWALIERVVGSKKPDGEIDVEDLLSIVTWQETNGLKRDGMVGPNTLNAIAAASRTILGSRLRGIDVSQHQGTVDWGTALEDPRVNFIILRASISETRDKKFLEYVKDIRDIKPNLPLGAYHFFRFRDNKSGKGTGTDRAILQAKVFCDAVAESGLFEPFDLCPVIDLEWDKRHRHETYPLGEQWWGRQLYKKNDVRDYLDQAEVWVYEVEKRLGRRVMVYTNPHFWASLLRNPGPNETFLYSRALWTSGYVPEHRLKSIPNWPWLLWQYTSTEPVQGFKKPIDCNVLEGSLDDLRVEATMCLQ